MNESVTYTQVSKVQSFLLKCKELEGKYSTKEIYMKQRGSDEPAKVLEFAHRLAQRVENAYAPSRADLMECAQRLIEEDNVAYKAISAETTESPTPEASESEEVAAPVPVESEVPSTSQPARSMQQTQLVNRIAQEHGLDPAQVENVVQAVIGEMNGAYLMGLIALANSLHYLAEAHDKLPGYEHRIKTIDSIREQYVQAGTLTIRKSRST